MIKVKAINLDKQYTFKQGITMKTKKYQRKSFSQRMSYGAKRTMRSRARWLSLNDSEIPPILKSILNKVIGIKLDISQGQKESNSI